MSICGKFCASHFHKMRCSRERDINNNIIYMLMPLSTSSSCCCWPCQLPLCWPNIIANLSERSLEQVSGISWACFCCQPLPLCNLLCLQSPSVSPSLSLPLHLRLIDRENLSEMLHNSEASTKFMWQLIAVCQHQHTWRMINALKLLSFRLAAWQLPSQHDLQLLIEVAGNAPATWHNRYRGL